MAKGYSQREGIDFKETFSPMSTKDSLRIIMAIVVHFDLGLHQMDVRTTFLNEDLVEDVYMSQPIGFEEVGKENMVCKLQNLFMVQSRLLGSDISGLMKLSLPMALRTTSLINAYI